MRRLITRIISPFLQYFLRVYFAKPRKYNYKEVKGVVLPTVFFPHFTMSTRFFIDFLSARDLVGKRILELGCGTGIISVFIAQNGGIPTATDINPAAIENAKLNAERNNVKVTVIQSDLFENIAPNPFDLIVINPPYYPKDPKDIAEKAWYCGSDFSYFRRLFPALPTYFRPTSEVYMILSEDCNLDQIKAIATENKLRFTPVFEKQKWGEMTYIYRIERILQ